MCDLSCPIYHDKDKAREHLESTSWSVARAHCEDGRRFRAGWDQGHPIGAHALAERQKAARNRQLSTVL